MDPDQLNAFLASAFPDARVPQLVTRADDEGVEVRWPVEAIQLRPGGTVSGPTLMTLADTVSYVAVVAQIGPEFLTVTSHLAIDFLRKAPPASLRATGEVIKRGRRQALVAVRIHSEENDDLVAHAMVTYALPTVSTVAPAEG